MPKGYKNYAGFVGQKGQASRITAAHIIKWGQSVRSEEKQTPEDSVAASQKEPPFKHAAFLFLLSAVFLLCGLDKYSVRETTAALLCFAFALLAFLLFSAALIIGIKNKRKR